MGTTDMKKYDVVFIVDIAKFKWKIIAKPLFCTEIQHFVTVLSLTCSSLCIHLFSRLCVRVAILRTRAWPHHFMKSGSLFYDFSIRCKTGPTVLCFSLYRWRRVVASKFFGVCWKFKFLRFCQPFCWYIFSVISIDQHLI